MNALKRFFITPYSIGVFVGAIHSLIKVYQYGLNTAWTGAAIATVPAAFFFSKVVLANTARTSDYAPIQWGSAAIGSALVFFLTPVGIMPIVYAVGFGLIGSLLYDFWYSRYHQRDKSKLALGQPLPVFALYDLQGKVVDSTQISQTPALLMFYRGNWCPLCMAQIKEVAAQYRELDQRGVKIYMISNQSSDNTAKLAEKFDVPLNFLIDKDLATANALGIVAQGGTPIGIPGYEADTNLPTVVMTDAEGNIIFADLTDNYRVRPEPEIFLEVLDEHLIKAA